jgi:hypothetical protein
MNFPDVRLKLGDAWANTRNAIHNTRQRLQKTPLDYVVVTIGGSLPEYIPPPPGWQKWIPFNIPNAPSGPSLSGLRHILEQIAFDPRPLGIVVHLNGFSAGWATAQSVRDALGRFRVGGKKVVVLWELPWSPPDIAIRLGQRGGSLRDREKGAETNEHN